MTEKELCRMCLEYSSDRDCENKKTCKLLNILKENDDLKKENEKLRKENKKLRHEMSYMISPNAIGDRQEMGG